MTENMKKLPEIVSASKELTAKVSGMGKEYIIAPAKELGVELTASDFVQRCELSDDDPDTVVGGGKCICSFGGGKAGEDKKPAPALWAAVNIPTAASAAFASSAGTETGKHFLYQANKTGGYPMNENKIIELNDEELNSVVGGYGVGDTVTCSAFDIRYCPKCGRLLKNYSATITGVRGILDGHTVYWVTYNCCGHKSSIIDTEILN